MATRILTATLVIVCVTAQKSKSTDDFASFNASLGGTDWVWVFFALFAILLTLFFVIPGCVCNSYCKSGTYDALSQKCYTEIINARGYSGDSKAFADNRPLSLLVLRQDLKEKQIWHNEWKKDFMIFIRNEHALFSTCFSHPNHPFSRRDRRFILLAVILLDFGIAMVITYAFSFINFSETASFILEYAISYIFATIMTSLESLLVCFAVCAVAEKCPTCFRDMCKCCSSMVLCSVLFWAIAGFVTAIIVMVKLAQKQGTGTFWEIFGFNFVIGLIQAWFLLDIIKMGLQFRTSWKDAHPPPPGPEREEDKKKKQSCGYKLLTCGFCCICFPCWLLGQLCCRKKHKVDPYDDGQEDFGVNYKEYLKWKHGEEIGDRAFPQSYAAIDTSAMSKAMQDAVDKRVDGVKQEVTKTYDANVAGLKKTGNKWKQKAMGVQIGLGKNKGDKVKSEEEEVELVVGQ